MPDDPHTPDTPAIVANTAAVVPNTAAGRSPSNPVAPAARGSENAQKRRYVSNPALTGTVCSFDAVRTTGNDEITRIAMIQHRCIHRQQLMAAGFSQKMIARRVANGRISQPHRDVYVLDGPDQRTAAMAAILHLRGDALLSGLTAAHIWGIWRESAVDTIDVTVVGRGAVRLAGVTMHRTSHLARQDIRWRDGLPLTSPARTLLDLAGLLDSLELEAALASTRRLRLVRDADFATAIAAAPASKRGIARLRKLLAQESAARDTRSVYERRLLGLIKLAELPSPVTNVTVAGHMVDMFWPDQRLVVEFDSWNYHHNRRAFERDRLRDQRIAAAGHRVTRVTARQVDHTPYATIARLAASLAQPQAETPP